jgi:hypothetical protein
MTSIEIDGHGHRVKVEHGEGELDYLLEKVKKLWDATRPASKDVGFRGIRNETTGVEVTFDGKWQ